MRWWLVFLFGCGSAVPELVAEPETERASGGSVERGRAHLLDREASRSGLACSDCHAPGPELRPARPLGALAGQATWWWGTAPSLERAIQRCAERFQRRPGPRGEELADLAAALRAWAPPVLSPPPTAPADIFRAACHHCHEAGPAPRLLGHTWPESIVRTHTLGPRPPGPDALMPVFSPAALGDVDALVRWLAGGGNGRVPDR